MNRTISASSTVPPDGLEPDIIICATLGFTADTGVGGRAVPLDMFRECDGWCSPHVAGSTGYIPF